MDIVLELLILFRKIERPISLLLFVGGLIYMLNGAISDLLSLVLDLVSIAVGLTGLVYYDKLLYYVASKTDTNIFLSK